MTSLVEGMAGGRSPGGLDGGRMPMPITTMPPADGSPPPPPIPSPSTSPVGSSLWTTFLPRVAQSVAPTLSPVDATIRPLHLEQWYLCLYLLQNDTLATEVEAALSRGQGEEDAAAVAALKRRMTEAKVTVKARILHERSIAAQLATAIWAMEAPPPRRVPPAGAMTSNSGGVERASPSDVTARRVGGGGGEGGRSGDAGTVVPTWPRARPLPSAMVDRVLQPWFPTGNEEQDETARDADLAFMDNLQQIALACPQDVPHVVERYLHATCRLRAHRSWTMPEEDEEECAGGGECGAPQPHAIPVAYKLWPFAAAAMAVDVGGTPATGTPADDDVGGALPSIPSCGSSMVEWVARGSVASMGPDGRASPAPGRGSAGDGTTAAGEGHLLVGITAATHQHQPGGDDHGRGRESEGGITAPATAAAVESRVLSDLQRGGEHGSMSPLDTVKRLSRTAGNHSNGVKLSILCQVFCHLHLPHSVAMVHRRGASGDSASSGGHGGAVEVPGSVASTLVNAPTSHTPPATACKPSGARGTATPPGVVGGVAASPAGGGGSHDGMWREDSEAGSVTSGGDSMYGGPTASVVTVANANGGGRWVGSPLSAPSSMRVKRSQGVRVFGARVPLGGRAAGHTGDVSDVFTKPVMPLVSSPALHSPAGHPAAGRLGSGSPLTAIGDHAPHLDAKLSHATGGGGSSAFAHAFAARGLLASPSGSHGHGGGLPSHTASPPPAAASPMTTATVGAASRGALPSVQEERLVRTASTPATHGTRSMGSSRVASGGHSYLGRQATMSWPHMVVASPTTTTPHAALAGREGVGRAIITSASSTALPSVPVDTMHLSPGCAPSDAVGVPTSLSMVGTPSKGSGATRTVSGSRRTGGSGSDAFSDDSDDDEGGRDSVTGEEGVDGLTRHPSISSCGVAGSHSAPSGGHGSSYPSLASTSTTPTRMLLGGEAGGSGEVEGDAAAHGPGATKEVVATWVMGHSGGSVRAGVGGGSVTAGSTRTSALGPRYKPVTRATIDAAVTDLRTLSIAFTRGLINKYPLLSRLRVGAVWDGEPVGPPTAALRTAAAVLRGGGGDDAAAMAIRAAAHAAAAARHTTASTDPAGATSWEAVPMERLAYERGLDGQGMNLAGWHDHAAGLHTAGHVASPDGGGSAMGAVHATSPGPLRSGSHRLAGSADLSAATRRSVALAVVGPRRPQTSMAASSAMGSPGQHHHHHHPASPGVGGGGGGSWLHAPSPERTFPFWTDVADCRPLLLRMVQEAMHTVLYDTMRALFTSFCAPQDKAWVAAMRSLRGRPPCYYGMGHLYCAANEPGCPASLGWHAAGDPGVDGAGCTPHVRNIALELMTAAMEVNGGGGGPAADAPGSASMATAPPTHVPKDGYMVGDPAALPPALSSACARAAAVYGPAIACLRLLPQQRTPTTKIAAVKATMRYISDCAMLEAASKAGVWRGDPAFTQPSPLGADDLMPRLCFVIAQAGQPALHSELAYMEDCSPPARLNGQDGYVIVSLRAAISHALHVADEVAAGRVTELDL